MEQVSELYDASVLTHPHLLKICFCLCRCMCVCMNMHHIWEVTEEDRRGCWVPLELESYAVVRGSTSVVKTKFRSVGGVFCPAC